MYKLIPNDLKIGSIYRSNFEIKQGLMKGERLITDQEYIQYNGQHYIFKIINVLTPDTSKNSYNSNIGDTIRVGYGNISRDYSERNL